MLSGIKPPAIRCPVSSPSRGIGTCFLTIFVLCCLVALSSPAEAVQAVGSEPATAGSSQAETLRLGERIYRAGILPSGKPVQAVVKGDLAVNGSMVSCVSCHRRSGLGSVEGGVVTPANTGNKLFQPSYYGREFTPAERKTLLAYYQTPVRRPAYTEETLAAAIRNGIDPAGRSLNSVMPRFRLSDSDMAILISYLKSLSAEPSPGVSEKNLRFATIVGSGVSAEDRRAMLATLEAFVTEWNAQAQVHQARAQYLEIAQEADLSFRSISLSRWLLDGPPATWRSQLEAYYRKEPVFALLGGIAEGKWQPIHEFSEAQGIPSIFPITDLPVISGSDWYTLYFSKGLVQEGEAAARNLARTVEIVPGDNVVQLFRNTSEGRALASGFEETWRSLGRKPPVNRMLGADEPIPRDFIRQMTGKARPQVLLFWLGNEELAVLEGIAAGEDRPGEVYLSASLLKQGLWTLPEPVREFASITYPYQLPQDEAMHADHAKVWLRARQLPVDDRRISTRMYSLMLLMNEVIPKMRRNFYRDYLLDLIDSSELHGYADYERLSFGPGQRYASKGCYIVTLSRGPKPILIRKSDWTIE